VWSAYIAYVILGVAVVGTISSTVFLVLALIGAGKFRRDAERQAAEAASLTSLPPVSLLKPVHGLEARLKENIESFFRQEYADYEILFAADDEDDAALGVIRDLRALSEDSQPRAGDRAAAVAESAVVLVRADGGGCGARYFGDQRQRR